MINLRIQPETTSALPEQTGTPRIHVFGVGGAGGNAVDNMIESNLQGVEFVVCNSDAQALGKNKAEKKIQLGAHIASGLGAGSNPAVGRAAAEESIADVIRELDGANMVFITAGMGGGTGTGAAPIIAAAARERGILTVGVVTKPFHFEGAHRMRSAEQGLKELEAVVDTLIVIPNQNLFRIANEKTTFAEAFRMADGVLQSGVRGVTDLMVMPGLINLDFSDIRCVMQEMGKAMMGTGEAEGEGRAIKAAEAAVNNPLLDDVSMKGARGVIINITGGYDMTLFEVDEACNRIRDEVDPDANIIFGSTFDQSMEGTMRVSVVATGIDQPVSVRQRTGGAQATLNARAAAEVGVPAAPFGVAQPQYAPVAAKAPYLYQPQASAPVAPPVAYSPTLKAPSAGFTIPSAPPVMEQPVPQQQQYVTPELPLMAAPMPRQETAFIPPAPLTPETPADIVHAYVPQADRAPQMPASAPAASRLPSMQDMSAEDRGNRTPSLFERLKGSIRRDAHPASTPAAPSVPQQHVSSVRRAPTAAQPTLDIETRPLAVPQMATQEDDLDIPAFLRRQAN